MVLSYQGTEQNLSVRMIGKTQTLTEKEIWTIYV